MIYIFPDTNFFLHCKPISDLDFKKQFGEEVQLCIPMITVKEIDKHKSGHRSKPIRRRALTAQKLIVSAIGKRKHLIGKNVFLELIPSEPKQRTFSEYDLEPSLPDHRFLCTALEFRKHNDGRVLILTNDTGVLILSHSHGIEATDFPEGWKRSELEGDPEVETKQLTKPHGPQLIMSFENGQNFSKFTVPQNSLSGSSEIAKCMLRLKAEVQGPVDPAYSPLADENDARRYNLELQKYFVQFEKWLKHADESLNAALRILELPLVIKNTGDEPTRDVAITLEFPENKIQIVERYQLIEPPPALPPPPRISGMFPDLREDEQLRWSTQPISPTDVNKARCSELKDKPVVTIVNEHTMRIDIAKLQHGDVCPASVLVRPIAGAGFGFKASIKSDQLRAAEFELNCILSSVVDVPPLVSFFERALTSAKNFAPDPKRTAVLDFLDEIAERETLFNRFEA